MSGVFELSLMFLVVGARGFTSRGLPLSARKRITGGRGRAIGALCLLLGLLGIAFAFWGSPPPERQAMRRFCYGVVTGIIGTVLVLGGPRFEGDGDEAPSSTSNPETPP